MASAQQTIMHRAAGRVLHAAVRAWPTESREWGCALEAEFSAIEAPWEALRWAMGGVMLLAKARWSEFLDWLCRPLGVEARGVAKGLLVPPAPAPRMPRGVIAVLLLAALAILLAPEAREGLREVAASWNLPGSGWIKRELDAMAREAERSGQQMRGGVTEHLERLRILVGEDFELGVALERQGKVHQLRASIHVDARDESFFGQPMRNLPRNLRRSCAAGHFLDRSVRKRDANRGHSGFCAAR